MCTLIRLSTHKIAYQCSYLLGVVTFCGNSINVPCNKQTIVYDSLSILSHTLTHELKSLITILFRAVVVHVVVKHVGSGHGNFGYKNFLDIPIYWRVVYCPQTNINNPPSCTHHQKTPPNSLSAELSTSWRSSSSRGKQTPLMTKGKKSKREACSTSTWL